jgi:hypothetical protein
MQPACYRPSARHRHYVQWSCGRHQSRRRGEEFFVAASSTLSVPRVFSWLLRWEMVQSLLQWPTLRQELQPIPNGPCPAHRDWPTIAAGCASYLELGDAEIGDKPEDWSRLCWSSLLTCWIWVGFCGCAMIVMDRRHAPTSCNQAGGWSCSRASNVIPKCLAK